MTKKFFSNSVRNFGILGIIIVAFFSFAYAKKIRASINEESINDFNSVIEVNKDNSIDVTEKIEYSTGGAYKHGILRDIDKTSSTNRKMNFSNISVTDENGNSYKYTETDDGSFIHLKIGDSNSTFNGVKKYVIKYKASYATAQYKDFDEIYWNTTGNSWNFPILKAETSVILPADAVFKQSSCYFGAYGSKNFCNINGEKMTDTESAGKNVYYFETNKILLEGEGMTIALGFNKVFLNPYTFYDMLYGFFLEYGKWLITLALILVTFIYSLRDWYLYGRDDKKISTIIPEYDVPDNLTPIESAGILNETVVFDNISAEIIYLAIKGYIKINEVESPKSLGNLFGLVNKVDYEIVKKKDFSDIKNDFDQQLLFGIFNSDTGINASNVFDLISKINSTDQNISKTSRDSTKISDIASTFYVYVNKITKSVMNGLLDKGYYKNLSNFNIKKGFKINIINPKIFLIFIFLVGVASPIFLNGNEYTAPVVVGFIVSLIVWIIFNKLAPAKTVKGVDTKAHLLGLKEYLQIAEKDRLEFHNAPEKKPEVFERFLPYAMVLGVSEIWAKEFEGIYKEPPQWYGSRHTGAFSLIAFNQSLSSFNSVARTMYSPPRSGGSGSGGGGFSGGGGGGGGGGSW